jgi:hypothetical protein
MLIISINPVPSQSLQVNLSGQNVGLNIYQKSTGLFIDVYLNGTLLVGGVICQNENLIVRDTYLGFPGDLAFIDNVSNTDPYYTGLGDQYSLVWLQPSDVAAATNLPVNVS